MGNVDGLISIFYFYMLTSLFCTWKQENKLGSELLLKYIFQSKSVAVRIKKEKKKNSLSIRWKQKKELLKQTIDLALTVLSGRLYFWKSLQITAEKDMVEKAC